MKKIIILIVLFSFIKYINAQDFNQAEKNNRFTFELFSKINTTSENVFLSPFSVSTALAMTYEGARGKTRTEMSEVLHFSEDNQRLNNDFFELISEIQKSKNTKYYTYNVANSIWAQEGYRFLHSFFTTVEKYYQAKIAEVNFQDKKKRESARKQINAWVSQKTENKIKNLLDKTALDKNTKMVLVNAVYFLAQWDKVFDKKLTKQDYFYGLQEQSTKDFMQMDNRMKHAYKNGIQLLEIPYKDKKASMFVLLPDTSLDFTVFKKLLNYNLFSDICKNAEFKNIRLRFPKFKIEYKNDLAKILQAAGIKRAFSNRADFSGMTCKKELQIDKVIHQTYIDVDESETEAAAATAVIMRKITSVNPADRIIFNANHPFIYLIKENRTESILFIGQLIK